MKFLRRVLKSFGRLLKFKTKSSSSSRRRFKKNSPHKKKPRTHRRLPAKPQKTKPKVLRRRASFRRLSSVKPKKFVPLKAKTSPRQPAPAAAPKIPDKPRTQLGEITHYFDRIQVCVIKITQGEIRKGQTLWIEGKTKGFKQKVASMQIESQDVALARRDQLIGLKVDKPVRPGDRVFKPE